MVILYHTSNIVFDIENYINNADRKSRRPRLIADTIALDPGRAVAAIRMMRARFKKPGKTAELLLLDMEAAGVTETVDVLRSHVQSL